MNVASLIAEYGYVALFVGTLLEGETVLILAGFAAHQGYLQLDWVIVTALAGGFCGDQFYFWLGRRHGTWVLSRYPKFVPLLARVNVLIERYHEVLIVAVRFLYGLRTIGPLAFGMSHVQAWRFGLFNMLGAAVWAAGVGGAGFLFGRVMKLWLHDLKQIEAWLLLGLLSGSLIFFGWRRWRSRKKLEH